jgi:enterochelin esterase-like enzyme
LSDHPVTSFNLDLDSSFLGRKVVLSILLPPDDEQGRDSRKDCPVLLFNDGQDFEALKIREILAEMYAAERIKQLLVVGIHAGPDRIYEYGVAAQADYAGRGNRAADTASFILKELIPFLNNNFEVEDQGVVYAGFSLGGLMALDIVWNHPEVFSRAGIFSGSLWWRSRSLSEGYQDSDRIVHAQIRDSPLVPALKFWFQCGSRDESDDRDGDGIIDSVQDTLECIAELERKGYAWNNDVVYYEMENGEHNVQTWALALPHFLIWAFGR